MTRSIAILILACLLGCLSTAHAQQHETTNFVVTAHTPEFAEQVGTVAEFYRRELAIEWLGKPLAGDWGTKCHVTCKVGEFGAGGATTFVFNDGEVFGWRMTVQGSEQRIIDSVIPHEISHTIFASHFRRPLPRWADEGAATLVEHESERMRQVKLLSQVARTSRRIPVRSLLEIREYPTDMQDVLTLYAEGFALADYLVQLEGKQVFLAFLDTAHHRGWPAAFAEHYQIRDIDSLDGTLLAWLEHHEMQLAAAKESEDGGVQEYRRGE